MKWKTPSNGRRAGTMLDTIFHSFWTFAGTLVLLSVVGKILVSALAAMSADHIQIKADNDVDS